MIATFALMALALAGALLAVSLKNVLHAIFGLGISLIGVAGLFALLNSPFVALMEILIYVGGITVAMVFAIMMSSVAHTKLGEPPGRRITAGVVALLFFAGVSMVLTQSSLDTTAPAVAVDDPAWGVDRIGHDLVHRYNLVFETLSVILLLAILGAISIAKRPDDALTDPPPPSQGDGGADDDAAARELEGVS